MKPMPFVRFCEEVLRLRMTPAWRVLLTVAIDGVEPGQLEGADRELARTLFGDVDTVPPLARRILLFILGRASGKTTFGAALGWWRMLFADVSMCGPGSVPTWIVVAPSKRTARLAVRAAIEMGESVPALRKLMVQTGADGFVIQRRDGRRLGFEAFAASRGGHAVRGLDVVGYLLDESWFFLSDEGGSYVVNDRDIHRAIVPRLLPGGFGVFISTPWPVETLTGELLERNFGAPSTALCAKGGTLLMRDYDPAVVEMVDRERATDPDNAAREFNVDLGAVGSSRFFANDLIDAAIDDSIILGAPFAGADRWGAGGDIALVSDSSAIAIAASLGHVVTITDLTELRPKKGAPLKLSRTIETFAETLTYRGLRRFLADGHVREPAREFSDPLGVVIDAAPEGREGKNTTYIETRKLFSEGRLRIPNHARFVAQLRSITAKPMPGGGFSIVAPRRAGQGHGDIVSAAVLAIFDVLDAPVRIVAPRSRESFEPDMAEIPLSRAGGTYARWLGNRRGF